MSAPTETAFTSVPLLWESNLLNSARFHGMFHDKLTGETKVFRIGSTEERNKLFAALQFHIAGGGGAERETSMMWIQPSNIQQLLESCFESHKTRNLQETGSSDSSHARYYAAIYNVRNSIYFSRAGALLCDPVDTPVGTLAQVCEEICKALKRQSEQWLLTDYLVFNGDDSMVFHINPRWREPISGTEGVDWSQSLRLRGEQLTRDSFRDIDTFLKKQDERAKKAQEEVLPGGSQGTGDV